MLPSAIRLFSFCLDTTAEVFAAMLEGRVSRYIAPPPVVEDRVIELMNVLWRAITKALRENSEEVVLDFRLVSNPEVSAQTAAMLPAILGVAANAGVSVKNEPAMLDLLSTIMDGMRVYADSVENDSLTGNAR